MRHKLVTGVDAASPIKPFCVEANLIRLGSVYPFEAYLRRADGQSVAINDPRHAR